MAEFAPVKLRSPDGDLHTAYTPMEVNNLVFGQGYTVVGNKTVADVAPPGTPGPDAPAAKDPAKKETAGG